MDKVENLPKIPSSKSVAKLDWNPVPSDLPVFPLHHPVSELHSCNCTSHPVAARTGTPPVPSHREVPRNQRADGARYGTACG